MYEEIFNKFKICAFEKCDLNLFDGKIIVAVSGGSDSVCMLLLLCKLFGNDRIICAHFNHKIRIGDSDKDAEFVKNLSNSLNVKFAYEEADVPLYAKNNHMGLEEAARILRYKFLNKIAENGSCIAVAHNKGDKVETIFHNISRGTSIDGLKGIEYKKNNIVRPLLDLSKQEIEFVCKHHGIKPVFDKTNNDNSYTRNKIRNQILPYLRKEFSDSFDEHILRLSKSATNDSTFMEKCTKNAFDECCNVENNPFYRIFLKYDKYFELDIAIKNRLIRLILSKIKNADGKLVFPDYTGIYSEMILRVEKALNIKETGKITEVSSGVICVSNYDGAYFTHRDIINSAERCKFNFKIKEITLDDFKNIDFKNKPFNLEYFDSSKLESLYGSDYKNKISMRKWIDKDVIVPIGMDKSKKIRDVLINSKIGRYERQFINLIFIENDVIWIPKIKRSNIAPIDKNSSRVIIIEYVSE